MKIAFFSYEYPPETGSGGIGTYLKEVSKLLNQSGHEAYIFTSTAQTSAFWESDFVYKIPAVNWKDFNKKLPEHFLPIHERITFDIAEGTDFEACGLYVKKACPSLPFVVKLHTPLYMVDRMLYSPLSLMAKVRFAAGAVKRFSFPTFPTAPEKTRYKEEFEIIELANRVSSASESIRDELRKLGFNLAGKTDVVPLPIEVSEDVRKIAPKQRLDGKASIVYIGRLESRKGVMDLAEAIPRVLDIYPLAKFTFVGQASISPVPGLDMTEFLKQKLKKYSSNVVFTGKVEHSKVKHYLDEGDIFVFPSYYESFGIACCEAMAAGKAVIGSRSGGMKEILDNGSCGILISPRNPKQLSDNIIRLIDNDHTRISVGQRAKQRIDFYYNSDTILPLQLDNYKKAIANE